MIRKTLLSAIGAGTLLLGGLAAAAPGATAASGRHAQRVCAASSSPTVASCLSKVMVNGKGVVPPRLDHTAGTPRPRPSSRTPTSSPAQLGRSDGGDRRRVRLPEPRGRPGDVPLLLRAPGLHDGERLPQDDGPERRHQPADATPAGTASRPSTSTPSRPPARTARSWWSRPRTPRSPTSAPPSTRPPCSPVSWRSRTATAAATCRHDDGAAYNHPGIAVTASTGDSGFDGGSYPATSTTSSPWVAPRCSPDGSARGFTRDRVVRCRIRLWTGTRRPRLPASDTDCTKAIADVSAAADPSHGGLAIYYQRTARPGPRSAAPASRRRSSPRSSRSPARPRATQRTPTANANLYDITSGSNGTCGAPVCTARNGWDGPTGLGTPNGIGAF